MKNIHFEVFKVHRNEFISSDSPTICVRKVLCEGLYYSGIMIESPQDLEHCSFSTTKCPTCPTKCVAKSVILTSVDWLTGLIRLKAHMEAERVSEVDTASL